MNPFIENAKRDLAFESLLSQSLNACSLGKVVYAFQEVSSTMEIAHSLASDDQPEGTLVVSLRQKQGRGRQGRTWVSPQGGLYCSFILRPKRSTMELPQLSLVAGLSTVEMVQHTTGLFASIRWPNDLLLQGRKLAGILIETRMSSIQHTSDSKLTIRDSSLVTRRSQTARRVISHLASHDSRFASDERRALGFAERRATSNGLRATSEERRVARDESRFTVCGRRTTDEERRKDGTQKDSRYAVIGIGLNVNSNFEELPEGAISLAMAGATQLNIGHLLAALCHSFKAWYDVWHEQGFDPIRQALHPWMGGLGQPVQITMGNTRAFGITTDVDESGRLLVRLDSGLVQAFEMGEVTLLR